MKENDNNTFVAVIRAKLQAGGRTLASTENAPLHTLRFRMMANQFLSILSSLLSLHLTKEVHISLDESSTFPRSPEEGCDGEQVIVNLRVYHQNIQLVLPGELVHDLGAYVLHKMPTAVISSLTNEEITAVSFLIASVLADRALSKQRIYLSSVHKKCNEEKQETSKRDREQNQQLCVSATVDKSHYRVLVRIPEELVGRLESYGKLIFHREQTTRLLSRVFAQWSLQLRLNVGSLHGLTALKEGQRFPLTESTGALFSPSPLCGEEGVAVEILSASIPGLLKLRIRGEKDLYQRTQWRNNDQRRCPQ